MRIRSFVVVILVSISISISFFAAAWHADRQAHALGTRWVHFTNVLNGSDVWVDATRVELVQQTQCGLSYSAVYAPQISTGMHTICVQGTVNSVEAAIAAAAP